MMSRIQVYCPIKEDVLVYSFFDYPRLSVGSVLQ